MIGVEERGTPGALVGERKGEKESGVIGVWRPEKPRRGHEGRHPFDRGGKRGGGEIEGTRS